MIGIVEQPVPSRTRRSHDDGTTPWRLLALLMTMTAIGSMSLNILVPGRAAAGAKRLRATPRPSSSRFRFTCSASPLAQLCTGPLSDRFGRRPVILVGFALATCASLGAILMSNAPGLIAMRFLQAIGGATGVAIGRAIIRDLFGRERSAQMIGLVASAMAIAPMVAPLIGGILDTAVRLASRSSCSPRRRHSSCWCGHGARLPETRARRRRGVEHERLARQHRALFTNRRFIGYVLSAAFGCGAFFVYVGAGPHVIITMMHRSPTEYGLWFIPTAGGYIIGNFVTSRLSVRFGIDAMICGGAISSTSSAALCGFALLPFVDTVGPLVDRRCRHADGHRQWHHAAECDCRRRQHPAAGGGHGLRACSAARRCLRRVHRAIRRPPDCRRDDAAGRWSCTCWPRSSPVACWCSCC